MSEPELTIDPDVLERRKNELSTTPVEDRPACEHCGSIAPTPRGTGHNGGDYEHEYYCPECQTPCDGTGEAKVGKRGGSE